MKPVEILSEEGLAIILDNAETILDEVGVEVRDYPSAIERFAAAGCDVDGRAVRFPRAGPVARRDRARDLHPARSQPGPQRA